MTGSARAVVVRELDDGAQEYGVVLRPEDAAGKALPEGTQHVSLRKESPRVYRVTEVHSGPARCSSPEYRTGWDAVFGKPKTGSEMN